MLKKCLKPFAWLSTVLMFMSFAPLTNAIPISFDATTTGTIKLLGTSGAVSVHSAIAPPIFTDTFVMGPGSASTAGTGVGPAGPMSVGTMVTQTAVASGFLSGSGFAFAEALTSLTVFVDNTSTSLAPEIGSATFEFSYTLDIFRTDPLPPNTFALASSFVELNFRPDAGASVSTPPFDVHTFYRDVIDTEDTGPVVTITPPPFVFTITVAAPGSSSGFVTAVDAMGLVVIPTPGTLVLLLIGGWILLIRQRGLMK